MNQVKVSAKRHLAKTISYRIISTLIGFLIMWGVTGKIEFGAAFGVIELLYKPIQYYIHERIWYKWISYGLIKVSPVKQMKTKNPRVFKKVPPPQTEPRIIKEGEQPPLPEVKRLTYTKKSDN
jgi:uncharacterized membrane protein